jgi:nucleoid DNA-binding protein
MYKTDVVRVVARQTRYSQKAVAEIIDAVHGVIKESLRKGEPVVFWSLAHSGYRSGKLARSKALRPVS